MNWMNILLMLFFVTTLFIGNTMYENDLALKEFKGVEHVTNKLDWNLEYNLTEPSSKDDILSSRIHNVVYKFADFLGYSAFEVTKTGIEFGYENPQYNYEVGIGLLKLLIIALILGALVPLFIPVVALITIIGIGIISLFKKLKRMNNGKR